MNQPTEQETRNSIMKIQLEKERNLIKAQHIVLEHLEGAIKREDSATVAAMAEILKA